METIESVVNNRNSQGNKKVRRIKKIRHRNSSSNKKSNDNEIKKILKLDNIDINKGINLMDLSEEDLDRGVEIITRVKKYMDKDERNILIKLESVLDLVKGIKKLNNISILSKEDESIFFRSMDEEDKKNMMIREILEVFPENKKQSVEKAIEIKKIIDLFAELFLPDMKNGEGFSLSSFADINNLGSVNNLKLLGNLLRSLDENDDEDEEQQDDESQYVEYDESQQDIVEIDEVEEQQEENNEDTQENNKITNKKSSRTKRRRKKSKRKSSDEKI